MRMDGDRELQVHFLSQRLRAASQIVKDEPKAACCHAV